MKHKKNIELAAKNDEITNEKKKVEEAHKEITDSINYAQRIQQSMLPPKESIEKYFPNTCVFFQPKNVVSGDFYRVAEKENKKFIAAVDCTGHGVPGGFLSMLGHELLNKSLEEKNTTPADIVTYIEKNIHEKLNRDSKKNMNDSMEIMLIMYDKEQKTYTYAGTKNDILIVKKIDTGYQSQELTKEELRT